MAPVPRNSIVFLRSIDWRENFHDQSVSISYTRRNSREREQTTRGGRWAARSRDWTRSTTPPTAARTSGSMRIATESSGSWAKLDSPTSTSSRCSPSHPLIPLLQPPRNSRTLLTSQVSLSLQNCIALLIDFLPNLNWYIDYNVGINVRFWSSGFNWFTASRWWDWAQD